jgi:hypothetical protein
MGPGAPHTSSSAIIILRGPGQMPGWQPIKTFRICLYFPASGGGSWWRRVVARRLRCAASGSAAPPRRPLCLPSLGSLPCFGDLPAPAQCPDVWCAMRREMVGMVCNQWLLTLTQPFAQVGGCCVCSDEQGWNENPLVYCDGQGCSVAVHQGNRPPHPPHPLMNPQPATG